MPELPDVEGFRRVLERHGRGKRIEAVEVPDRAMLRNSSPSAFSRALRGGRFKRSQRRGKWLLAPVGRVEVLLHFGMTGSLEWARGGEERHRHDRLVFRLRGGELRYRNMRRFGGVWLARDERERGEVTGRLGPDAADIRRRDLEQLLERHRGGIKAALMDQKRFAGVGNLLSDEVLWRARIDPRTPVSKLGKRRRDALYDALRKTLRGSIRAGRVPHSRNWLTRVRDERGAGCPRCGTKLRKATVAGRTACWCPRCQRR